jgi:hypothetical protein
MPVIGSKRSSGRGGRAVLALAIALLGLGAMAPGASAQVYKFRVLSGSESNSLSLSNGCKSGTRSFSSSTATPSEDPNSAYDTEFGEGSIGAKATSASFFADEMNNSCSNPTCHYEYGTRQLQSKSIGVYLEDAPGPNVKVSAAIFAIEVGSIEGPCGDISVNWPAEPSTTVPEADLFSGNPVDITISGNQPFNQDNLGNPITGSATYTYKMRVEAIGENLRIDPAEATDEDQGPPSGHWLPKIPVSWKDKGCTDPKEDTATPRAYLIAGPKRGPLGTLLGTKEESLAGAAGFSGRALKLKKGISTVAPATVGANGVSWKKAVDAAATGKAKAVRAGSGVFYGGRIACKLKSKPGQFTVKKSAVFTLCHDQSSLSGEAWTGLVPEMRAALDRLWGVLRPLHACYAPSSGFRSQKTQDGLRERWHKIADRGKNDDRTQAEINSALDAAGFAQDPLGYGRADRGGKRVARGGPARFSLHSLGIAADIHVEFSDTGAFEENLAKLQAAAHQAGLCGPPASDKVHVELPFIAGKDPETGFTTLESVVPKDGKVPECSDFTDVPPPKPDASAADSQNPLNGIRVNSSSPVGGTMSAAGSLSGAGRRLARLAGPEALRRARSFRLRPASKRFQAGQTVSLKLKLPSSSKPAVAAALRHGAHLVARLVVTADYAGSKGRTTLTVPLGG